MQGQPQGFERVVTPEAVAIELDIAGLGSRMIAALIDGLIQLALLIVAALLGSGLHLEGTASTVVGIVVGFLVLWGYFFIFEGLWHGRTPGKRGQRLRVVRSDGHPMSGAQMFVRNLVRIVDFLPAYYAVGAISVIVTKRAQRIGDLAAGTIVVRERKPTVPTSATPIPSMPGLGPTVDTTGLSETQYQLVRSFLERRDSLDPEARIRVATQIAAAIQPELGRSPALMGVEQLLETVAASYRGRFALPSEPPPSSPPSVF